MTCDMSSASNAPLGWPIDGETNLKSRHPVLHQDSAAAWVPQNVSEAARLRGRLLVEHPTASLHSFNGRFELWVPTPSISTPSSDEIGVTEGSDNAVVASVPVTLEVRASAVTDWCCVSSRTVTHRRFFCADASSRTAAPWLALQCTLAATLASRGTLA
jgi:hypothetical protein